MGQKTNPTALRLEKTNQHYRACWYSDRFYPEQLHNTYKTCNYITKVFNKIKRISPLIYIKATYQLNQIFCIIPKKGYKRFKSFKRLSKQRQRKNIIFRTKSLGSHLPIFYNLAAPTKSYRKINHYQEIRREIKEKTGLLTQTNKNNRVNKTFSLISLACSPTQVALSPLVLALFYKRSRDVQTKNKVLSTPENTKNLKSDHPLRLERVIDLSCWHFSCLKLSKQNKTKEGQPLRPTIPTFGPLGTKGTKGRAQIKVAHPYDFNLEGYQSKFKRTRLYPIKASFAQQNSQFLAQKISNALKNRVTFPRLRRQILWDISKSKYVKGVRVTLSGRVESKSKKAQKARARTFQWGQTELHVLSSLVQFTSQDLITPFGKIGIKVWICYG